MLDNSVSLVNLLGTCGQVIRRSLAQGKVRGGVEEGLVMWGVLSCKVSREFSPQVLINFCYSKHGFI